MSDQETRTAMNQDMRKMPVILMVVFTMITAGIYCLYWFLTRRDQINELHSDEKLGKSVFIFAIVFHSISLFSGFVSGILGGIGEVLGATEFLAMEEGVATISSLLSLTVGIIVIVQCFKVRRVFRDHFNEHLGRNVSFSGLATFLFQNYYLQYKINRFE